MEALFLKLFNMSITAGWIVLAVAILRLLLKKAPKAVTVFLWALVGVRLICPFSFESVLSLIPSGEPIPEAVLTGPSFKVDTGISAVDSRVNEYLGDRYFEGVTVPAGNGMTVMGVLSVIWLIGIAAMLIYAVVSYIRVYRQVREAVRQDGNIYVCDRISAPFILGVFRPKIYLPSSIDKQDAEYVIAHERAHLKRRDHLIKPFGFLLLTVYWFNPVMWIAYILLCRDIELACDERVIKELGEQAKKPYSSALINCSMPRRSVAACPLAFGEVGVKSRIKSVLNYKKPAFWIIAAALALCVILPVVFLTNPKSPGLCDIENRNSGLLDNVTEIRLNKSGIESDITQKTDVDDIVSLLKKVKINRNPYNLSRSEDRDRTNEIVLDDNTFLYFDKNFELVRIYDGVKPTLSYKIKNPDEVKKIFNKYPNNYGISGSVISAECDDIEYEYLSGSIRGEYPHISVRWTNKTDDILCYGEEFTLYRDGKICERAENTGFNLLLHVVKSRGSEEEVYNLSAYNLQSGNYRLEKQFYLKSDPDKKYRAFIEFSIDKTYSFLGKQYLGEKIIYENGLYSFVLSDTDIPQFLISDEDFSLLTSDYPESAVSSTWFKIDGLQKITLKKSNFDDLFETAVWKYGYTAKSLRKNNLNAFSAFDLSGRMYYLLEQKNGDIFIAQGYTQTNSFRWIFKMREAD